MRRLHEQKTVAVSEARVHLGELMDDVANTDLVVIVDRVASPEIFMEADPDKVANPAKQSRHDWLKTLLDVQKQFHWTAEDLATLERPEDIVREFRDR